MLKCFPYRYITQEICKKAVDAYILALGFVPDRFVMSKMHEYINDDDNDDDDYDDYDDHEHYKNYDITILSKLSLWYKKHTK